MKRTPDNFSAPIEPTKKKPDGNINDWAGRLREVDASLAEEIDEPRGQGLENVKRLDLPRGKDVQATVDDFLSDPDKYLTQLNTKLYWIILESADQRLPRFSNVVGKDRDEIESFVRSKIAADSRKEYVITANEYRENFYGGNIVINKDGKITIEMKKGIQSPIAKGTHTPEFFVSRDPFLDSFKYSFEDEELRIAVQDTLDKIPSQGEGREKQFLSGYYEFSLIKKEGSDKLEPVFFDYRDSEAYQLNSDQIIKS